MSASPRVCSTSSKDCFCVAMHISSAYMKLHVYVEQQRGKDAALWMAILLSASSAAFADEVHKLRLFDDMFWTSSVSLTSCGISKNVLVRTLLSTVS